MDTVNDKLRGYEGKTIRQITVKTLKNGQQRMLFEFQEGSWLILDSPGFEPGCLQPGGHYKGDS